MLPSAPGAAVMTRLLPDTVAVRAGAVGGPVDGVDLVRDVVENGRRRGLRQRVGGRAIGTRNRDRPGDGGLQRDKNVVAGGGARGRRAVGIGGVDLRADV